MTNESESGERFRLGFLLILVAAISAAFLAMVWRFITPVLLATQNHPAHTEATQYGPGKSRAGLEPFKRPFFYSRLFIIEKGGDGGG